MQYRVEWGNAEQPVIIQSLDGNWNDEDLVALARETRVLAEAVTHTVHIIIDVRKASGIPRSLISKLAPLIEGQVSANQGTIVCIGANDFIKGLVNIARMIAPRATANMHFVRTMQQAWAILQKEVGIQPPPASSLNPHL
jgi:hypothetical protein